MKVVPCLSWSVLVLMLARGPAADSFSLRGRGRWRGERTRLASAADEGSREHDSPRQSPLPPASSDSESRLFGSDLPLRTNSAWPLKTMVFVDGTWLYYSMHSRGRLCPIQRKFGVGWQQSHRVDWRKLPVLVAMALEREFREKHHAERAVEIIRTVVFTSCRADTPPDSLRVRMFREMEEALFEVHMATTNGQAEKCVDIALAVDMMHYASSPDAYDVAVLLSGDKDFMPAMTRTRQNGKRVALAAMRRSCNKDLLAADAHVKDFSPIFLDDYLDQLILPNDNDEDEPGQAAVGRQLLQLVTEACVENGGSISSRDIGRFLQSVPMDDDNALNALKTHFRNIYGFCHAYREVLEMSSAPSGAGADKKEFLVALREEAGEDEEPGEELKPAVASATKRTEALDESGSVSRAAIQNQVGDMLVVDIKAQLRERGLAVGGLKAELADRLVEALLEEQEPAGVAVAATTPKDLLFPPDLFLDEDVDDPIDDEGLARLDSELVAMVRRCVQGERDGCSSRDVGRYLQTQQVKLPDREQPERALTAMKEVYGSLSMFLQSHRDSFSTAPSQDQFEFLILPVNDRRTGETGAAWDSPPWQ